MIIEHAQEIVPNIMRFIGEECYNVIDKHKDIFTDEVLRKFKIKSADSDVSIGDVGDIDNGSFILFKAICSFERKDGLVNITELALYIDQVNIERCALRNIHRFEKFFEFLRNDIQHEMGHFIYYLTTWEGKPWSEVIDDIERYELDLEIFKRWVKDNPDNPEEANRKYHDIPFESMADVLGDVDVEFILEFDNPKHEVDVDIEIIEVLKDE